MKEKPLILVGGGGHCKSVIEAAESVGREIKGILDLPEYLGYDCIGYKVIGTDADIQMYAHECEFIVTLGFITNPEHRIQLHRLVEKAGGKFGNVIASSAHVSRHAYVARGSVVLHNADINAGAHIGKGCIINTGANIEHDVRIGNYSHVSTGAMVNGDCRIGESTFIGSGAVVANGVSIADNVVIGAGAVVCSDVNDSGTYIGIPARKKY
ncbi:MAG: acetyltransferase [Muribaculaceae bacterium]|nr:acetyltransferase [Muribaculaceae bacterium]